MIIRLPENVKNVTGLFMIRLLILGKVCHNINLINLFKKQKKLIYVWQWVVL
jgi:hypothetical protein